MGPDQGHDRATNRTPPPSPDNEYRLLEALIDAIPDVIGLQDSQHVVLRYNEAGYRFLRLRPEDLNGRRCYEFIGRDRPCEECATTQALATGRPAQLTKFVPEMGLWIDVRAYPILDKNGKPVMVIEHLRDITETRRMEERLRHLEKMEAIGQLAGGVAHDFNNQLVGILGFAELLAMRISDPELRRYVDGITASAQRSADLTRGLLAFARKGKYLAEPVDLHALLTEVELLLRHSIDRRIAIRMDLRAAEHVVSGDSSQLQNAFLNLALNARDAMPEGGELTFSTEVACFDEQHCRQYPEEIQPGAYVAVSVTDTGTGMSEATRKRIFEPFFTTKGPGRGVGLGLPAVYGTVRSHGGRIGVYSELGHGTTFRVYLPLAAASAPPAAQAPAATAAIPANRKARILLVDDEETVRVVSREMLAQAGYEVAVCTNGPEALARYVQAWRETDVVILDMVMPQMSGRDLFLALRRINPEIKAILSTGFSLNGEAQKIVDEGVRGFVQKPFHRAQLIEAVERAMKGG